jgi:pimeloyl-ACP methyl ester carboxylesterase
MADAIQQKAERLRGLIQQISGPAANTLRLESGQERDSVGEALERVRLDRELRPQDVATLEAIVLPNQRPVIDVVADSFTPPMGPWEASLQEHRARLEAAIRVTGRVELVNHPSLPYGGTAFLIGPDLLLTSRHVAESFLAGVGTRDLNFYPGRSAFVDLRQEVLPSDPLTLKVVSGLLIHPYWDAALLRVTGVPAGREPLRLLASEPERLEGREVAVIGYPAFDSSPGANQDLQMRMFGGKFERKRLQPGTMMAPRKVPSYGSWVEALAHNCSTLGGNSGSVVLDLQTGHVMGLHFAGQYLIANYAVPAWALAADRRVTDLGAAIAGPAGAPPAPSEAAWNLVEARPEGSAPAVAVSGGGRGRAEDPLPASLWYERVTDEEIALSLRRDPAATRQRLEQVLGREEADEVVAFLQPRAAPEGPVVGPRPDPELPPVVYVHGLLGAHLDGASGRPWLNPLALVFGDVAGRLRLEGEPLQPGPHLKLIYERAARRLRDAGFPVHAFSFDWRRGLAHAADRLHHFLELLNLDRPGRPAVIVAHSMGGPVAALYAQRHPTWADRVQRAIFLGAPLGGSFAPFEAVTGTFPLLLKLDQLAAATDLDGLRSLSASLPGLLDLLPDPALFPEAEALYTQAGWPDDGHRPPQRWLDQSRALKPLVARSPILERATALVGLRHGTVASLQQEGGRLVHGPRTSAGDGTVPARAAALAGLPAFELQSDHNLLPREPAAIQAVMDLIRTGRCSLPPVAPSQARAELPRSAGTEVLVLESTAAASSRKERLSRGELAAQDLEWLLSSKL